MSKVYTNSKKVQHLSVLDFFDCGTDLKCRPEHSEGRKHAGGMFSRAWESPLFFPIAPTLQTSGCFRTRMFLFPYKADYSTMKVQPPGATSSVPSAVTPVSAGNSSFSPSFSSLPLRSMVRERMLPFPVSA